MIRIKHQSTQMNTAREKHKYVDWFITINLIGRFGLSGYHIIFPWSICTITLLEIFYTFLFWNLQHLPSHPHLQLIIVSHFPEKNGSKGNFHRPTTINTHVPEFYTHIFYLPSGLSSPCYHPKASPPICVPDPIPSCLLKDSMTATLPSVTHVINFLQ